MPYITHISVRTSYFKACPSHLDEELVRAGRRYGEHPRCRPGQAAPAHPKARVCEHAHPHAGADGLHTRAHLRGVLAERRRTRGVVEELGRRARSTETDARRTLARPRGDPPVATNTGIQCIHDRPREGRRRRRLPAGGGCGGGWACGGSIAEAADRRCARGMSRCRRNAAAGGGGCRSSHGGLGKGGCLSSGRLPCKLPVQRRMPLLAARHHRRR